MRRQPSNRSMGTIVRVSTLAAAMALATAACGSDTDSDSPGESDVIRVAVLMPTSGPAGSLGKAQIEGMQLRIDQANREGGVLGKKLEVTVYDDAADPATGVSAFTRAANQDNQRIFMGPVITTVGTAVADYANEAGALLVSPTIRAEAFTEDCKYCYSLSPSEAQWAAGEAAFYLDLGAESIYAVGDMSETARNDVTAMKDYLDGQNATIVGEDYIDTVKTQQYAPFVERVSSASPDLVHTIIASVPPQVAFLREALSSGLAERSMLTMSPGLAEDTVAALNEADVPADGLLGVDFWISATAGNAKNDALRKMFVDEIGNDPTKYGVLGYATADVLLQAISEADSTNPEEVAGALDEIAYDSPFSNDPMQFVNHRFQWDPERFLRLRIEDGKLRIVD